MPRRTFFFITYLLGNVFSRLRGLTGHEVVRNKRPNDDGPLKRGGPLDVAAVKVDRDQNLYQEGKERASERKISVRTFDLILSRSCVLTSGIWLSFSAQLAMWST